MFTLIYLKKEMGKKSLSGMHFDVLARVLYSAVQSIFTARTRYMLIYIWTECKKKKSISFYQSQYHRARVLLANQAKPFNKPSPVVAVDPWILNVRPFKNASNFKVCKICSGDIAPGWSCLFASIKTAALTSWSSDSTSTISSLQIFSRSVSHESMTKTKPCVPV